MKKLFSVIITCTISFGSVLAQQASLEIGSNMPLTEMKMQSVEKKNVSLDEAKGKNGLLVMFSCNTCPFVVRSQMRTKEVMRYALKNNIGMIIINANEAQRDEADSYEAMKKYAAAQEYKVPYVIDEADKMADAFGATHTPEVFLFNASGKLIYKGAMEDNPAKPSESKIMYLQNAMEDMLAGKEPNPDQTKSIGCSIKRKA